MIPEELRAILEQLTELKKTVYLHFQSQVNAVKNGVILTQAECEQLLDGLLDYCDDDNFFSLYKETCQKLYNIYPELVTEHILAYRSIFNQTEEKEEL